ncbi:MAG TPA: hypothetical protein VMS65_14685 [Polyangiaceae bacterium]|nr:hypothetical protein [Polyangiaceae bacterium]
MDRHPTSSEPTSAGTDGRRDVFTHIAYEAYEDLITELSALTRLVLSGDKHHLAKRYVELDRESFARGSVPHPVASEERADTEARLGRFGASEMIVPDVVPERAWCGFVRRSKRLERLIELGAPSVIIEDFRDKLLGGARTDLAFQDYVPPVEIEWTRPSNFVADAVYLCAVTFDDVGIGNAVNDLPEARAFLEQYPGAYGFWDIHRQVENPEELEMPEPRLRPSPLWLASAVRLPCFFPDTDGTPISYEREGPATFGMGGSALHPALCKVCAQAVERGLAVVGYIAVSS